MRGRVISIVIGARAVRSLRKTDGPERTAGLAEEAGDRGQPVVDLLGNVERIPPPAGRFPQGLARGLMRNPSHFLTFRNAPGDMPCASRKCLWKVETVPKPARRAISFKRRPVTVMRRSASSSCLRRR